MTNLVGSIWIDSPEIMKVKINNKEYTVTVPVTFEEKRKGLSDKARLADDEGMLFVLNAGANQRTVIMNTVEMRFTINMLFVGADKIVKEVFTAEPGIKKIKREHVAYIIELKEGEAETSEGTLIDMEEDLVGLEEYADGNILIGKSKYSEKLKKRLKLGGTIDIKTRNVDTIKDAMQVLDDKGYVLMNIFGGERIFSIDHTKKIVSLAEKVQDGSEAPEKLGELLKEIIQIHETQEPEYTDD